MPGYLYSLMPRADKELAFIQLLPLAGYLPVINKSAEFHRRLLSGTVNCFEVRAKCGIKESNTL
jgi:hypothetical protein